MPGLTDSPGCSFARKVPEVVPALRQSTCSCVTAIGATACLLGEGRLQFMRLQYPATLTSQNQVLQSDMRCVYRGADKSWVLLKLGRATESIAEATRVFALAPNSVKTYNVRSDAKERLGSKADAREDRVRAGLHADFVRDRPEQSGRILTPFEKEINSYSSPRFQPAVRGSKQMGVWHRRDDRRTTRSVIQMVIHSSSAPS